MYQALASPRNQLLFGGTCGSSREQLESKPQGLALKEYRRTYGGKKFAETLTVKSAVWNIELQMEWIG